MWTVEYMIGSVCACVGLFSFVGCNYHPAPIHPPAWDPSSAAARAMAQYDRNGDGVIAGSELDASAGLKAAASVIDSDHDNCLRKEEIAATIEQFRESRVGLLNLTCFVRVNGQPVSGASVKLIPEKFLGDDTEPAEGITDQKGLVVPSIPEENRPNPRVRGVRLGIYRVEISQQMDGREQLPAKYNAASQLGLFVGPGTVDMHTFNLVR